MAESVAPGGTPPAPTVPPVAAQPAASSSTVQDSFNSTVQAVKSPAEVRAAITKMNQAYPNKGPQPKPVVQQPAPEPVAVEATPAAPEPEATTPEASEATPAPDAGTEPQSEVTEPPADDPPDTEDDGGEGPIVPVAGKRAHLRLGENDNVGRLAASYMKRNRDLGMADAVAKAQQQLGIKPDVPGQQPEAPKGPTLPQSTQETDNLVEQKFRDYEKAMTEVRFEDAAKINREIHQLTLHRSTLERRAEQAEAAKIAKYDADFTKSESKAVDLYPFVTDPASPGAKRMAQIEATLKANGDPLYYSADKPLKLAQMVAAELNIAPRNKSATPAKPAAAPAPAAPAPKKGVVPTGASRTVPPATSQPAVDPAIAGIKTHADLRTQLRRFGIK